MRRTRQSAGVALVTRPERVEAALWRRLREGADPRSRDTLFAQYQDVAKSLAHRRARLAGADAATRADLQQAAMQGLVEAIDRFDPTRNVPFAAYARRRISGALSDVLARLTERSAMASQIRRRERERQQSLMERDLEKTASPIDELAEIAVRLALSLLLEGQELQESGEVVVNDNAFDTLAWRQLVGRLTDGVAALPDKERAVIIGHYHQDLLFADIAATLDITAGRVSQLHRAALTRLAKKIGKVR